MAQFVAVTNATKENAQRVSLYKPSTMSQEGMVACRKEGTSETVVPSVYRSDWACCLHTLRYAATSRSLHSST